MAQTRLKACDLNDLKEVLNIAKRTFIETFAEFNDPVDFDTYVEKAFSQKQIASELAEEASIFYLLYSDDQPAGYPKLNLPPAQTDLNEPDSLEIERIYVEAKFHGMGLGKVLFAQALKVADQEGSKYVWLGVWEKNEKAMRFYTDRGFYKFAKHPFKLGDDLQTDLLMRLDL